MFRGNRAADGGEGFVHGLLHVLVGVRATAGGGAEMQIAVADVAEGVVEIGSELGVQAAVHLGHVFLHVRDAQAHIENEQRIVLIQLRHIVAHRPDALALRLAGCEHRVFHQTGVLRGLERRLEARVVRSAVPAHRFHEHIVGMVLRQRRRLAGRGRGRQTVEVVPQNLERRERAAEPRVHQLEQFHNIAEVGSRHKHRLLAARFLAQAQHGAGDHA